MRLRDYQTPILSDDLQDRIGDAISAFNHRGQWKEWGLDKVRRQGAAILFHGPPGTGKTITAYYVAKKLHLGIKEISMADYGSHVPGELARNIKKLFMTQLVDAKVNQRQPAIVFLDECDAMLVSRKKLGQDMIWMLEPIDALLTQIANYPGLVILSTNLATVLDEAIERRLIAKVYFDRPTKDIRYKIWKTKWPTKFPVQPSEQELTALATYDLSGAQIENVFLLWAGRCVRKQQTPIIAELLDFLKLNYKNYFESGI